MKRKNSSFYTKCQSNKASKTSFLLIVTANSKCLAKFFKIICFYQRVALITNFIVCIAGRS